MCFVGVFEGGSVWLLLGGMTRNTMKTELFNRASGSWNTKMSGHRAIKNGIGEQNWDSFTTSGRIIRP